MSALETTRVAIELPSEGRTTFVLCSNANDSSFRALSKYANSTSDGGTMQENMPTNLLAKDSTVLQWNAGLIPLVTPAGIISLSLESRQFLVTDVLLQRLVLLLQQPMPMASLISQMCPPEDPEAVRIAVAELCAERIIVPSRPQPLMRNASAFWDIVPCVGPSEPVAVKSVLPSIGPSLEALLNANGVTVEPSVGLTVLVTSDYTNPETGKLASGGAALLAKAVGNEVWIGPVLSPETPLCWACLVYWLNLRRWPELHVHAHPQDRHRV